MIRMNMQWTNLLLNKLHWLQIPAHLLSFEQSILYPSTSLPTCLPKQLHADIHSTFSQVRWKINHTRESDPMELTAHEHYISQHLSSCSGRI